MTPQLLDDPFFSPPMMGDGADAEHEAPQAQPGRYGEDNVDLPLELQNALFALMQEAKRQDLYQRRLEVMRDRRNRFYDRGIQHIYEDAATGSFVQGSPGAWVPDPAGGELQCSSYINDYNIFSRCLQIIIAKLSENPVGVDFQPDSGDNAVDLQASEAAEAYRLLYDRRNDIPDLTTAIVRMMGLSGRTVTWTRTIADKQRWGTDQQGRPRRCQTTTVYGTLESKVPILAKDLSNCPYVLITEDPHLYTARMEHPLFADKINEGGDDAIADTQYERLARVAALQGSTTAYQMTQTYQWYVERNYGFFRPAMFMDRCLDSDYVDADTGERTTLRGALQGLFPDGACVTFVGSQYVGSRPCCLDDEIGVDFPYAGDGMSRMAIMDPAVIIQDRFNDDMNGYAEVKDFGWPSTWINGDKTDVAAINDQTASPYAFRPWKSTQGMALSDQFFREPNPDIPGSFMQHTEYMATQLMQFILAIPSAVQGAGMPDQKTASGYTAALNQALGQLGVIWGAVQRLMSRVYRQAALAASREAQDQEQSTISIPGPKGSVTLNMSDLGKGHFLCHPDKDSGYPESTVQKRSTLSAVMEWMTKNPAVAEAVMSSPDNWDFMSRIFGLPELTIPEARVRRKQLAEIEILLQQSPVGPTPEEIEAAMVEHAAATMHAEAGGPPPAPLDPAALQQSMMRSSITPDELDYHPWEFEECREFLSDWPKVQQQINAGNQAGIQNVRLHALEHQQFMAQAAAAAQAAALAAAPRPAPGQQPPAALPGAPEQPADQTPPIQ